MKKFFKNSIFLISILTLFDLLTKTIILVQTPFPLSFFGYYKKLYPSFFPISKPLPFFNLILIWNNGISFSIFSNSSLAGRILLILLTIGITSYIVLLLKKEKSILNRAAFILIISGAIGNIFDRIRYGAVIDFLDFYIGSYHWPAFNLADIYICTGVGLIILNSILAKRKK